VLIEIKKRARDSRQDERVRIAFVAANRELLPDPVIPLGLLYVLEACPARHDRQLLDLCFEPHPEQALREFVRQAAPDLVALSLRNLQSADYGEATTNVQAYRGLVAAIREVSDAPIVLGGGGYSLLPEALLETLGADFGVAGEGEVVFPSLVRAFEEGADLGQVAGLYRRVDGRVEPPTSWAPFVDLSSLRFPSRRRVDRRHYARSGIESVQTKRGCPLRCSYCTYPTIEGRRSRLRPASRVADELEHIRLEAPEANHFFIVDSVFNLPRAHALAVCDAIRERAIGLPWTCYINPLGFDAQLAERMRAAGCVGIELGSDSGSDRVLERLRKGFDSAAIRGAHRVARDAGLLDCHTFLLGTPGETLDEVRRSLDFIADLDCSAAILMVWNDDAEALRPASPGPRAIFREQVLELLREAVQSQARWVAPPLGERFDARLFGLLRRSGLRGPLWQHLGDA